MYSLFKILHIIFTFSFIIFFTKKKNRGKKIAKSLQVFGPSFIKLGQALSVRPDIVGEDIAKSLTKLQDKVPAFSFEKAKKTITKELGKPIDEIFEDFSKESISAASVAQVHKAKTKNGDIVAVKILRPKIEAKFSKDLKLFYKIAQILNLFKRFKRLKPIEIVNLFASSIQKEIDLRIEAASASELKEKCKDDNGIYIPKIYWQLTSRRVLTIEWIDGITISDTENLEKSGHSTEELSKNLSLMFLNQSFRDGFFHADMHPGNLFVDKNGNIVPVDFGIMGRIDKETRIFVAEILRGFLSGNYEHVAKIHFKAGYVPKHKSVDDFMLACRAIGEPIIGLPADQVSIAKLLMMLFKVTEDFEMETQTQLLLLQKNMVLVEGVGQKLYPEVNMWQQAEGWIQEWAKDNLSPEARIKDASKDLLEFLCHLPQKIRKIDQALDKLTE